MIVRTYDWVWDGGRLCLDFINTLRDRWLPSDARGAASGRPEPELLRTPGDLAVWLHKAGLAASGLAPSDPAASDPAARTPDGPRSQGGAASAEPEQPSPADLHAARELREAIDRVLQAAAREDPLPLAEVRVVNAWAVRRPAHVLVAGPDGGFMVGPAESDRGVTAGLGAIAADLIDLLAEGMARKVRVCGSDSCGLRFLDRSRGGSRQWCSMGRCGNREKARAHYARTRSHAMQRRTAESGG